MAFTYKDISDMLETVDGLEQANQYMAADQLEKFAKTQLSKKLSADLALDDEDAVGYLETMLGQQSE